MLELDGRHALFWTPSVSLAGGRVVRDGSGRDIDLADGSDQNTVRAYAGICYMVSTQSSARAWGICRQKDAGLAADYTGNGRTRWENRDRLGPLG